MTVKEAAEALQVSRMHIYRLIKRGKLHPVRRSVYEKRGPVGIPTHEVEALLHQP